MKNNLKFNFKGIKESKENSSRVVAFIELLGLLLFIYLYEKKTKNNNKYKLEKAQK